MSMFALHGLACRDVRVHERIIGNRKQGLRMHRRWIQAVFSLAPGPPEGLCQPGPDCWPKRSAADGDTHGAEVSWEWCGLDGAAPPCQRRKRKADMAAAASLVAQAWADAEAASKPSDAYSSAMQQAQGSDVEQRSLAPVCARALQPGSAAEAAAVQWLQEQPSHAPMCDHASVGMQ